LIKKFQISDDNARKLIQRKVTKGILKSSKPWKFDKGQYVYFATNKKLNKKMLLLATKKTRSPLYRILKVMMKNEGIISLFEAHKLAATPLNPNSTTKVRSLQDYLDQLTALEIAQEIKTDKGSFIVFAEKIERTPALVDKHLKDLSLNTILLSDIIRWLQKHNLISTGYVVYRKKQDTTELIEHNNLNWDAFAYTRATGFHERSEEAKKHKQTLVVIDNVMDRDYLPEDLSGFYDRIQNVRHSSRQPRKVLPIVFYRNIDHSTLVQLKSLGILNFKISTLFGNEIDKTLSDFRELQRNLELPNSVDNIKNILSSVERSGQEDNLQNIIGTMFELIIYRVLKTIYNCNIMESKEVKCKEKAKKYEYDFIIDSSDHGEMVFVEVKGKKSNQVIRKGDNKTKDTVDWFLRETFPFAKDYYKQRREEHYQFKICYITTAKFEDSALRSLEACKKMKPSHLEIYYDGERLIKLLKNYKELDHLRNIIERYYLGVSTENNVIVQGKANRLDNLIDFQ
jgi:hypothetical protein